MTWASQWPDKRWTLAFVKRKKPTSAHIQTLSPPVWIKQKRYFGIESRAREDWEGWIISSISIATTGMIQPILNIIHHYSKPSYMLSISKYLVHQWMVDTSEWYSILKRNFSIILLSCSILNNFNSDEAMLILTQSIIIIWHFIQYLYIRLQFYFISMIPESEIDLFIDFKHDSGHFYRIVIVPINKIAHAWFGSPTFAFRLFQGQVQRHVDKTTSTETTLTSPPSSPRSQSRRRLSKINTSVTEWKEGVSKKNFRLKVLRERRKTSFFLLNI